MAEKSVLMNIIKENKWKLLPKYFVDEDNLKYDLDCIGWDVELDKGILEIENQSEIAYVEIKGVVWQICYNWVPLWRGDYSQCLGENWSDMIPRRLAAVPVADDDKWQAIIPELEKAGFVCSNFEGF